MVAAVRLNKCTHKCETDSDQGPLIGASYLIQRFLQIRPPRNGTYLRVSSSPPTPTDTVVYGSDASSGWLMAPVRHRRV